jgi:hypothetical protein
MAFKSAERLSMTEEEWKARCAAKRYARDRARLAAQGNAAKEKPPGKFLRGAPEGFNDSTGDKKLDELYRQYDAAETGLQKIRNVLSGVGGAAAGAGIGAGLGYGGASLVNAVAGRQVADPGAAARGFGLGGGVLGGGFGGIIGGSHGQEDVNLGKLHEKVWDRENKVL